jgi:hypothetical protein
MVSVRNYINVSTTVAIGGVTIMAVSLSNPIKVEKLVNAVINSPFYALFQILVGAALNVGRAIEMLGGGLANWLASIVRVTVANPASNMATYGPGFMAEYPIIGIAFAFAIALGTIWIGSQVYGRWVP